MKKTYIRHMLRGLKQSGTRFIAIMAIVGIGVGFLGGLLATTPDMRLTFDEYYDDYNVYDIDIKGSLGLTDDDLNAVQDLGATEEVTAAKVTDINLTDGEASFVTRLYGLSELTDNEDSMNRFRLVEGRMPENSGECLIASPNGYTASHSLGETYRLSEDNKAFENLADTYNFDTLTVVGIVESPLYLSVESEPSTVGSGRVGLIMFASDDCYSLEPYTDFFIKVKGATDLDTFSEEYELLISDTEDELEAFGEDRSDLRYSDIKADAQEELDKAKKEYDDEKADAEKKLDDAKKEIEDGKEQISDAEETIADSRVQIEDGKAQLSSAQAELDNRIKTETDNFLASVDSLTEEQRQSLLSQINDAETQGKAEIQSQRDELARRSTELNEAEARLNELDTQLISAESSLAEAKTQLDSFKAQLDASQSAIDEQRTNLQNEVKAQREQLESIKDTLSPEDYQRQKDAIDSYESTASATIDQSQSTLDLQFADYNAQKDTYDTQASDTEALREQVTAGLSQVEAGRQQITDGLAQIDAAEDELTNTIADKKAELEASVPTIRQTIYNTGMAQIESARADAQATIDSNAADLATAEAELEDGEKELAEKKQELMDGEKEYNDKKAEADEKLADAEKQLKDAQDEIDKIESPGWYILDRDDTVSYTSYESNSGKIGAIAKVFPIFFFLVAALVALTTMTRMVEEERIQIGTMKALGYSRYSILFYYLAYAITASLVGSVIGICLGYFTLPGVIANAYSMMYVLPATKMIFRWDYALIIIPIAIFCTTAATLNACLGELREKPAALMLPKAPKAGKRILLEYIRPLWKRLSFTKKVTARNIFRYKKRFFMTVFGIAGCCALLVTGFGIRDSIRDIVAIQFDEIYNYNLSVSLKDDGAAESDDIISSVLSDSSKISSYAEIHSEAVKIDDESLTLYAPKNSAELKEMIRLRTRNGHSDVAFEEDSVVITEKFSESHGINTGDTVEIVLDGGKKAEFKVTGISENYISAYVFISSSAYSEAFGTEPEYKLVLASVTDELVEFRNSVSSELLRSSEVSYISFSESIRESFSNSVKNIDYIVIVLIVCAGGLAVIVLYNLTNINICERKKELATIKVLGFRPREVAAYIYRETTVLSIIGIIVGFFLGIFLHGFVIQSAEIDSVMFGRSIKPLSYVLAALVTLIFTALVDLIMLRKLNSIDMVESMKANE